MLHEIGTQTLETPRLTLRRFTVDDAPAMFANWANDAEVCRYLTWEPHGQIENTRALLERWVAEYENPQKYQWVIVSKEDNLPIGAIGVGHLDARSQCCEIGYCMGRAWWGRGLMTEALQTLIVFLFEQVGMYRIEARHDPMNLGSGRVMEKAGMRLEGTLRGCHLRRDGVHADLVVRAILLPEYLAAKQGKR